jgi:hypothetical protein
MNWQNVVAIVIVVLAAVAVIRLLLIPFITSLRTGKPRCCSDSCRSCKR